MVDSLTDALTKISLNDKKNEFQAAILISSLWRGYFYRTSNLPNSIKYLKMVLVKNNFKCSKKTKDGRTNSCIDEDTAISILEKEPSLKKRIKTPKTRHWFDLSVFDYKYGWLPINIKSTTILTADNTGNLAMCLYALTDTIMDLDKSYQNGDVSNPLSTALKKNNLNKKIKKDYYFIVINKTNTSDIIINSFKGLTSLTPNINNLPFQVKWRNNRNFVYRNIQLVRDDFIQVIKKPKPSWREEFLTDMRGLE